MRNGQNQAPWRVGIYEGVFVTFHRQSYFTYKSAGARQSPYVEGNGGCTECPPTGLMRQPIVCTDFALLIHPENAEGFFSTPSPLEKAWVGTLIQMSALPFCILYGYPHSSKLQFFELVRKTLCVVTRGAVQHNLRGSSRFSTH